MKYKFRAWIKKDMRMELCIGVNPFHISDCDRFLWKHEEVELMPFTGFTDKNNVEIFTGDIIRNDMCWDMYSIFDEETCQYRFLCTDWVVTQGKPRYLSKETLKRFEIIGNIYDNPELMQTK